MFKQFLLAIFCLMLTLISCSKSVSNKALPETGTWYRVKDVNKKNALRFIGSNEYELFTLDQRFTGSWIQLDSVIEFVDTYCGTKLPGTYKFAYSDKDTFSLKVVEDKYCSRPGLFGGVWYRHNNDQRQASTISLPTPDVTANAPEKPVEEKVAADIPADDSILEN